MSTWIPELTGSRNEPWLVYGIHRNLAALRYSPKLENRIGESGVACRPKKTITFIGNSNNKFASKYHVWTEHNGMFWGSFMGLSAKGIIYGRSAGECGLSCAAV